MSELCPEDRAPLSSGSVGLACGKCGGAWIAIDELGALVHGASVEVLAAESRASSPVFANPKRCPDCEAVLAPWRIGQVDAWAHRCPACERLWIPKSALRSLERETKRHAVSRAYQSFTPQEREEIARDLAVASEGDGYPLSPIHATLTTFGLPVIRRTQGTRTPLFTWLLALAITAVFTIEGSTQIAQLGFHPANPTLASAITANFAHFGFLHLLGNLYFLLAFGDGVEQRLPRPAVWILFLLAGTASLAFDGWMQPEVEVIAGASGGIAALMGACVMLQPQAVVLMNVFGKIAKVPIWTWGLIELGYQALMALLGVPGTAYLAHLAGLVLGALAGLGLRKLGIAEPDVDVDVAPAK